VKSDSDFNEAFATSVGQEGARRWLAGQDDSEALQRYEAAIRRNDQFTRLALAARDKLELLYGDSPGSEATMPSSALKAEKTRILSQLYRDYENLKQQWGGYDGYDAWFDGGVNNAKLNSVATYYDLVPAFERLLAENDNDLERFYRAVKALSKLPKKQRHQRLNQRFESEAQEPQDQAPPL
jgi:predicted aminopeptidase